MFVTNIFYDFNLYYNFIVDQKIWDIIINMYIFIINFINLLLGKEKIISFELYN